MLQEARTEGSLKGAEQIGGSLARGPQEAGTGRSCTGGMKDIALFPFSVCPQNPEAERGLEDDGDGGAKCTFKSPSHLRSFGTDHAGLGGSWRDDKGGREEMEIVSTQHG